MSQACRSVLVLPGRSAGPGRGLAAHSTAAESSRTRPVPSLRAQCRNSRALGAWGPWASLLCLLAGARGKWSVDTARAKQNGSKKDGLELGESSYGDNLSSISLLQACNASQHGTHYPVGRERAVLYGQEGSSWAVSYTTLVKDDQIRSRAQSDKASWS